MTIYSPNLFIIGSTGQLGQALVNHSEAKKYQILTRPRQALDITSFVSLKTAIHELKPNIIINSAAYTAVDKAEQDKETALQTNHLGAKHLALLCEDYDIPLIHISTDYVFDGFKSSPYREEDAVNPLNVYGESKWLGEEAVREHCEKHITLRVSGIFSEYGNNFLKTMLRLFTEKKELSVVQDQITCPTYAEDIAVVIYQIVKKLGKWGTYHYCSLEPVSWHAFASSILNEANRYQLMSIKMISAITAQEFNAVAKRPAYSVLDCQKLYEDYGVEQAKWVAGVKIAVEKLLS